MKTHLCPYPDDEDIYTSCGKKAEKLKHTTDRTEVDCERCIKIINDPRRRDR